MNIMKEVNLTPRERLIYEVIIDDMKTNQMPFSKITNGEIAKKLDISLLTVRDKVLKIVKKGYLVSNLNYWADKHTYIQRALIVGPRRA